MVFPFKHPSSLFGFFPADHVWWHWGVWGCIVIVAKYPNLWVVFEHTFTTQTAVIGGQVSCYVKCHVVVVVIYVFIYICMYIYIYIHTYTYIYIYDIHIHIHIHTYIYIYMIWYDMIWHDMIWYYMISPLKNNHAMSQFLGHHHVSSSSFSMASMDMGWPLMRSWQSVALMMFVKSRKMGSICVYIRIYIYIHICIYIYKVNDGLFSNDFLMILWVWFIVRRAVCSAFSDLPEAMNGDIIYQNMPLMISFMTGSGHSSLTDWWLHFHPSTCWSVSIIGIIIARPKPTTNNDDLTPQVCRFVSSSYPRVTTPEK